MNSKTISEFASFHSTVKGTEIQEHLEKIYDDLILETYGVRVKQIESDVEKQNNCLACGFSETRVIWSERYSGYRGICNSCKHNWPES